MKRSGSFSPFCMHVVGVDTTCAGGTHVYCDMADRWMNVAAGECFGNCEAQELIDGTEPWEWKEPKEKEEQR